MRITSLTISNFRCFGEVPTTIHLDSMTTFVGGNASGKTAGLAALARLFGVNQGDRGIRKQDFHLPPGKDPAAIAEMTLFIEARIDFPELAGDEESDSIPAFFRQMKVEGPNEPLHCRVRLDAKWIKTTLPDGDIEESLNWVNTSSHEVKPEQKQRVTGDQRSRIQVIYVPATRDPLRQLRQAAGTLMHRLLGAVRWSEQVRNKIEESSAASNKAFREEKGVSAIEGLINKNWSTLHDFSLLKNVHLQPMNPDFEDLLQQVEMVFSPGEGVTEQPVDRLSDGLKSLFYLTLIASVFHVEEQSLAQVDDNSPLLGKELEVPPITVLAIEEPENHLAPHYLGRILGLLAGIAGSPRAQVLLTSHSPAILKRIDPVTVRHMRLDLATFQTSVRRIILPNETDEAHKYVREAVRAYPELYFSRLVILGEGASEEIVIPRLCEEASIPVDPSFVSVVPLGGRHVNHFWRLLNDLSVPFVTLVDLDRERETGGWERVHYLISQLLQIGVKREDLLTIRNGDGSLKVLNDQEFAAMSNWAIDVPTLEGWVNTLETHNVFMSYPLDLDFAMFMQFPNEYQTAKSTRGPRLPDMTKNLAAYQKRLALAIEAVLSSEADAGKTYTNAEKEAFIWYQHLFLGRGKPSTHIVALNSISKGNLWKNGPTRLKKLVERVRAMLG